MKILHIFQTFLFSCFTIVSVHAQQPYLSFQQDSIKQADMREFETAKKILMQIRDSQNSPTNKSNISALITLAKEITYICSVLLLGGGSVVLAAGLTLGFNNLEDVGQRHFSLIARGSCIVFPTTIVTAYVLLKLLVRDLLVSQSHQDNMQLNIQEVLTSIDQTLNKFESEMKQEQAAKIKEQEDQQEPAYNELF